MKLIPFEIAFSNGALVAPALELIDYEKLWRI